MSYSATLLEAAKAFLKVCENAEGTANRDLWMNRGQDATAQKQSAPAYVPAPKLGPNSSQHPVDYSSAERAVAMGWRNAITDLLQTMICSSVQIVNGEEVVGYQIKTGVLRQIVGLSNGELWFPIGLPSVAEQSASAPPSMVHETIDFTTGKCTSEPWPPKPASVQPVAWMRPVRSIINLTDPPVYGPVRYVACDKDDKAAFPVYASAPTPPQGEGHD